MGAPKIILDLSGSISNWKKRFFYFFGTGWEYEPGCPSVIDLKTWFTEPISLRKSHNLLFLLILCFLYHVNANFLLCLNLVIIERKPNSTASEWIEDAKHFSVKNHAEITAPEMLWRFGLGHRPKDMDPTILTVDMLNQVRPFVVLIKGSSYVAVAQTSKGGPTVLMTTKEKEKEEDSGLQ